jgi:endoglucanase
MSKRLGVTRREWIAGSAGLLGLAAAERSWAEPSSNPVVTAPKLNQVGFLPNAPKRFVMTVSPADTQPHAFRVENAAGQSVFEGSLDPAVHDVSQTAGEFVRTGDFSALAVPGNYRVGVGSLACQPFEIGGAVFAPLLRDAARAFYLIRANDPIDDPVTGLKHKAAHLSEASLEVDGIARDLTGGWYNAGDYGKWTHMAAMSASQIMWLYELRADKAQALTLDVPPIYPGVPDLLQQAQWGLEWLLKMQNPDGSVLHKVDSQPLFAWGKAPEEDPNPRAARGPSSIDAGVFVGVMAQASRIFAVIDKPFADRCRSAALRSWAWLERNPNVLHNDPYYADRDPRQEHLWAICEMANLNDDKTLAARASDGMKTLGVLPFFWPTPQLLGAMSFARSSGGAAAREAIGKAAEEIGKMVRSDPYGYSPLPEHYFWGSVEVALDCAVLCLFAAELTGDSQPRETAQRILDYVLGCNALAFSFVTGHGTHGVVRPYHWTTRVWNIVMPGWAVGGPNHGLVGADPLLKPVIERGTPPAKCYVDACERNGSWASNEGQTSENAALLLSVGLYSL